MPYQLLNTTLLGERTSNPLSIQSEASLGSYLSSHEVDTNRSYEHLQTYSVADRTLWTDYHGGNFIQPFEFVAGERFASTKIGISTFGIEQNHVTIIEKEKRIRRWPREWHGDNM